MPSGDLHVILTVTDANNQTATDNHTTSNEYLGGGCTTCPDKLDFLDKEEVSDEILIYPNPASEKLFVKGIKSKEVIGIIIYDMNGKVLVEINEDKIQNLSDQISIDTSTLGKGNYLLKIEKNNNSEVFKFSK